VNFAEITRDELEQFAYETFSIERTF